VPASPVRIRSTELSGNAHAKIAHGLVSDLQTRVVFRQPFDQIDTCRDLLGLTERETDWAPQPVKGRAAWRVNGRGAVVQTVLTRCEAKLFGTDTAMAA
jgi:hypothetical protein